MNFFGKKKKNPSPSTAGGSSYPRQAAPNPGYPAQGGAAPPPYTPPGQYHPSAQPSAYPPPPQPSAAPTAVPPAPGYPVAYQPAVPVGKFEAGARFVPGEKVTVPPPPPGVAPTMVQMQAAQGRSVVVEQKKAGLFSGGGDGGVNFEFN